MTINEAIEKWYDHFIAFAKATDRVITNGYSTDDVIHDMLLMALRKWGEDDVDEQTLFDYLEKSCAMQLKFQNKKKNSKEVPFDSINNINRHYSYTPELDFI